MTVFSSEPTGTPWPLAHLKERQIEKGRGISYSRHVDFMCEL